MAAMDWLRKCLEHSLRLASRPVKIPEESVPDSLKPYWAHETMWVGQKQAVFDLKDALNRREFVWLCSPTGTGKTAVVVCTSQLTGSHLIVVPRKALQDQYARYHIVPVFGRSEYTCALTGGRADEAPCLAEHSGRIYCPLIGEWCDRKYCPFGECRCSFCEFRMAIQLGRSILEDGGEICCNHGNMWLFLKHVDFVTLDETDLILQSLMSSIRLRHVSELSSIQNMLEKEIAGVYNEIDELKSEAKPERLGAVSRQIYRLRQRIHRLKFFLENRDVCFSYEKNGGIFVEIKPMEADVVLGRYFRRKGVILVSATPFDGYRRIEYRIPHRSAVYYTPVGKLTRNAVARNPGILDEAVKFIREAYLLYREHGLTRKAVVHCGNLEFASYVASKLNLEVDLHEKGGQRQVISSFRRDDAEILCVVGAEYGIDFAEPDIALQFVLKVPYATRDERIEALEKEKGYETWYERDALMRLIQACGRVARANEFSATFILDSKFFYLFNRFRDVVPDWFKERVVYAASL